MDINKEKQTPIQASTASLSLNLPVWHLNCLNLPSGPDIVAQKKNCSHWFWPKIRVGFKADQQVWTLGQGVICKCLNMKSRHKNSFRLPSSSKMEQLIHIWRCHFCHRFFSPPISLSFYILAKSWACLKDLRPKKRLNAWKLLTIWIFTITARCPLKWK